MIWNNLIWIIPAIVLGSIGAFLLITIFENDEKLHDDNW